MYTPEPQRRPEDENTTVRIQRCLTRLEVGDEKARRDLMSEAYQRLKRMIQRISRTYEKVLRLQTHSDLVNGVSIKMLASLENIRPRTTREFFGLATLEIRRVLIDEARKARRTLETFGHNAPPPNGHNGHSGSDAPRDFPDARGAGRSLRAEEELHEIVEKLPDDLREVFELAFYWELSHREIAAMLGVCEKTVQKRWRAARLQLHELLGDLLPGR